MVSESYAYLPNDWRRVSRTADGQQFFSVFENADESHEYLLKTRWDKDEDDERRRCPDRDRDKPRLKLLRQFIGGPGTDDLELTRYHGRKLWTLKDGIGSTIALTNRGGNAVARIGYDAFGNFRWPDKPGHGMKPCDEKDLPDWLDRLDLGRSFGFDFDGHHWGRHFAKVLTPFLFTGRRWDGFSGQYWNRNRYYQPKYGRFSSSDPLGFNGGNNLWSYAGQNPVTNTDPYGDVFAAYFLWQLYQDFRQTLDEIGLSEEKLSEASEQEALAAIRRAIQKIEGADPCDSRLEELRRIEATLKAQTGRSPYPPARRHQFSSKKAAYEAAKRAGGGREPIHHAHGEHGPHYHPDVPTPKPSQSTPHMPNPHDHYYYPG